jgi:hypothetical protein
MPEIAAAILGAVIALAAIAAACHRWGYAPD